MKIKRYTGTNTREVLTRIRNDLGPDAVILSNREIVGGVELMAAVDFDASRFPSEEQEGEAAAPAAAPQPNPPRKWRGSETAAGETASASAAGGGREGHPKATPGAVLSSPTRGGGSEGEGQDRPTPNPAADLPLPAVARVDTPITLEQKDAAALAPKPFAPAPARVDAPPPRRDRQAESQDELGTLRHELHDLRQWMQSQMSGLADAGPLTPLGEQLQALGFSTARARQLGSDALNLRGALAAYLGKGLQVAADPVSAAGIYALVGPTGAGKTTTIAKLAARLVLRH
ncbi:MAG: flagellar biosynthesis protein FlhF, partial [Thiomonas sp.]